MITHGPWQVELSAAGVEHVRYRGHELLRSIGFEVRDQNWAAARPSLATAEMHESADGLSLELVSEHLTDEIRYECGLHVGFAAGQLTVEAEGLARKPFQCNRIGLCVRHPAHLAGTEVTVVHASGPSETTLFPKAISAREPFQNVAGLRWRVNGIEAELDLAGDVFETVDERNWTDASFKTYGTPSEPSFPAHVEREQEVHQKLVLRVRGGAAARKRPGAVLEVTRPSRAVLPDLGLGGRPATIDPPRPALRGLPCGHLVAEVFAGPRLRSEVVAATAEAEALDCPLHLWLVADQPDEVAELRDVLSERVTVLGVYDRTRFTTTPELAAAGRAVLRPGMLLAGGTRAHFAELNRMGPVPTGLDLLTVTATPQAHSLGTACWAENAAIQRNLVAQASVLGLPVHFGPVTLRPRLNPAATEPWLVERRATDPQQADPVTAAWTLASLAAATAGGASALTYFEPLGPRGIAAEDGALYPVGQLLATLDDYRGARVMSTKGGKPTLPILALEGIVLVGNLGTGDQEFELRVPGVAQEVRLSPGEIHTVRY